MLFRSTPVKRYSSGMYVRLAFAVAAHLEPEILIVDEVLAVGDSEFQKKCLGKMENVAKEEGRTILFVSHDLQAVLQLTRRTILLVGGTREHDGPSAETIAVYRTRGRSANEEAAIYEQSQLGGRTQITKVRVHTNKPAGVHICGEDLAIEFRIDVPRRTDDLTLSFQIVDAGGIPMTLVWYQISDYSLPDHVLGMLLPGGNVFKCRLPKFRLFMGRYTITAMLFSREQGHFVDELKNVAEFEVMMPPGLLSFFSWQPGSCRFLTDALWEPRGCGEE